MSTKKQLRKIFKQILRVERRVVSLQIDTPAPFFYATCPVCGVARQGLRERNSGERGADRREGRAERGRRDMSTSAFPPACPWCGKLMTPDEIKRHYLGCQDPDPNYNPPETQRLREFLKVLYGEEGTK